MTSHSPNETTNQAPASELRYGTILADPPWDIHQRGNYGAIRPYPLMSAQAICNLRVDRLAATDAHLWLWVTNAAIHAGHQVMQAWGFTYRSCLTWIKPRLGLGHYLRNQTEHLLLGTRGSAPVLFRAQGTWLYAPVQEHSHKPEEQSTPRHSPTLGARGSHTDLARQFGVPRNLVHPRPTAHHSHPKVIAALTSIETNLLLCVTIPADASKKGETVVRALTFRPIPLFSPPVVDLLIPRSRPRHRAPQGLPNDRAWALFTVVTFEAATERLLRGAGS